MPDANVREQIRRIVEQSCERKAHPRANPMAVRKYFAENLKAGEDPETAYLGAERRALAEGKFLGSQKTSDTICSMMAEINQYLAENE